MDMFAEIVWWVMASAGILGFLAAIVESILVLQFMHTGRIPHIFGAEYSVATTTFITSVFIHIIALLLFVLYPEHLNALYETRTFLVWTYVTVVNAFLIATYALPKFNDIRLLLGTPHVPMSQETVGKEVKMMYISYAGIILAHGTILCFSYFHIFDQIPSTHLLAFLLISTIVSGVVMPLVYRLRISLENNL